MASAEDVKPDVKPPQEQMTVCIKDQSGDETFFKIKKTTKMGKIFGVYAERKGVQVNSIRFTFDGLRVGPEATPDSIGLEDSDQIDCMIEQTGGATLF
mmetsp:Transcript_32280/g.37900  ORF Transcript_32280/g.37900 Transcript_32280/m.37900 type:complete len:98 (-) Transcript_32280:244-537(-)